MSPDFISKWESLIEDVDKHRVPVQFIKKLIIKLKGTYKNCKFTATIKFNVKIIGGRKYKVYNTDYTILQLFNCQCIYPFIGNVGW